MGFNISFATHGHVTLSNFRDLSESISRFKMRMQVVSCRLGVEDKNPTA